MYENALNLVIFAAIIIAIVVFMNKNKKVDEGNSEQFDDLLSLDALSIASNNSTKHLSRIYEDRYQKNSGFGPCDDDASRSSIDDAMEKHIDFRNMIDYGTRVRTDPVDRINGIRVIGADYQNAPIKQIYDDITKNQDVDDSCKRLLSADRFVYPEQYDINGKHGYIVNPEWKYDNERVMNGGMITDTIGAYDPTNIYRRTI